MISWGRRVPDPGDQLISKAGEASVRSLFPVAVALLVVFALPGAVVFAADLLGHGPELNSWLESRLGLSHRLAVSVPAAVALFCVPLVLILLYFLRLRRKPVPVSSTFLWHKSIEDLHVNRLMQWLRRNILLLLQLLAVLLLIYGVLGPRLHATLGGGRHYVLVLDNSASMSATDVPPSRLKWAKAEAIKEIDAATDDDSGMVIVFNRTAEIRQSYTTNRDLLRAAVRGVEPAQSQTRLDEALNLAASLANPTHSTEDAAARPENTEPGKDRTYVPTEGLAADVHLYSDGGFPPVPGFALANLSLNYHAPPAPRPDDGSSDNLALVRLDAARGWVKADAGKQPTDADRDDPAKLTVTAAVRNYRGVPVPDLTVRLEALDADGKVVGSYAQKLRLGAKTDDSAAKDATFFLADVPEAADLALRVTLENAHDSLPLDDTAWLVPGVARKSQILAFMPDNPAEKTIPGLRRFLELPSTAKIADATRYAPDRIADRAAYLDPAREGKYDLVIFDRCGPATVDELPRANTFFVGHPPPPFKLADVKPVANPRVTGWSGAHPITRRLRGLYEIPIADAFRLPDLPPKTDRLMESDGNLVLLAGLPRPPFTDLVLAFPIIANDGKYNTLWPLDPSFIVFLRNVLRTLGNVRDALADDITRPGDLKSLWPGSAAKVRVKSPSGREVELERGTRADVVFAGTGELGIYATTAGGVRQRFAVNLFDPAESDLCPRGEIGVGDQKVTVGESRRPPRDLWKFAVVGGLLVLLLEWWVYNKRVQV